MMRSQSVSLLLTLSLLYSVGSLTINMDEKLRSKAVVMILQKSHPSMILFPNDEKIVINYSGRRFWAINMKEGEESVSFGKTKTEPDEKNDFLGKYKVSSSDTSNTAHPNPVTINQTHISYQICSQNICEYQRKGNSCNINKCSLTQTTVCQPFSNLYYQDLQFMVHLQLVKTFQIKGKELKFYDAEPSLRLWLEKIV